MIKKKKRALSLLLCILMLGNIWPGLVVKADAAEDAWKEVAPAAREASHVFYIEDKTVLVQKEDKKSYVYVGDSSEESLDGTPVLDGIVEIDAAYCTETGDLYLVATKNGAAFYRSTDGGQSWTDLLGDGKSLPAALLAKYKTEGLYVEDDRFYLFAGDKQGLFLSEDGGITWNTANDNIPAAYEARGMWKLEGSYYVATKKQGVLVSEDGENFVIAQGASGLATEKAKEIFEVAVDGNTLWVGTKEGLYRTDLSDEGGAFVKIEGLSDEVKHVLLVEGRVYVTGKTAKNLYYIDETEVLRPFGNRPDSVIADEPKDLIYDGGAERFILAHKKGLLRIEDDYSLWDAVKLAALITAIGNPAINATTLTLPDTTEGYGLTIASSSNEAVIALDGTVTPPEAETPVTLTLRVTHDEDADDTALTDELTVTVPKRQDGDTVTIYEGSGTGRNGTITVKVTVVGELIAAVEILSHGESVTGYEHSDKVIEALGAVPQRIVDEQSLQVDTVSSATRTSRGIIQAATAALAGTPFADALADENWTAVISDGHESAWLAEANGRQLYVSKAEGKSSVSLMNTENQMTAVLSNVGELETGDTTNGTKTVYLIGQKQGALLRISRDGGLNWEAAITMTGLPAEKVEFLRVVSDTELLAIMNKYGMYRSVDGGVTWSVYNNDLPVSPEKATEYDARRLYTLGGQWFLTTKKQGLLTSADGVSWTAFKNTGLSSEAKDVWDLAADGNTLYITGKNGLWRTGLNDASSWEQISGFTGESRRLIRGDGRLYLIAKDMTVHYMDDGILKVLSSLPAAITGEDPKHVVYQDGSFTMAHKYGLVKLKNPLIQEEDDDDDTDAVSGASKRGSSGGTPVKTVQASAAIAPDTSEIVTSSQGDVRIQMNEAQIQTLLDKFTGLSSLALTFPDAAGDVSLDMDRSVLAMLEKQKLTVNVGFEGGEYRLPAGLVQADAADPSLGELKRLSLTVRKAEVPEISGLTVLTTPREFVLEAVYAEGTREISYFGGRKIERVLTLPAGIDPARSIGAVYEDGTWKPVHTVFETRNGVMQAVLSRNTNSIYSVIQPQTSFEDMADHWSRDVVSLLAGKLVIRGNGNQFMPNGQVTRAEFTAMLVRGLGLNASEAATDFTDVASDVWYSDVLKTAQASGIVTGDANGAFGPDQPVTREQMVLMASRAMAAVRGAGETVSNGPRWQDGSYTGEAKGVYGTPMRISVTVKSGIVTGADILENHETPGVGEEAVRLILDQLLKVQSTEVDTVAGATVSSKAALEAAQRALDASLEKSTDTEVASPSGAGFSDRDAVSPWALTAVTEAVADRLISGYPDGSFRPKSSSSRAEAAVVIRNVLQALNLLGTVTAEE